MKSRTDSGAMRAIRWVLSPILNVLLEPIICRVADRLRPSFDLLHARLDRLDRIEAGLAALGGRTEEILHGLIPPFLPTVIKNEAQNLLGLPLPLLRTLNGPGVMGYFAGDVAARLPGSRVLDATAWPSPGADEAEAALPASLVFLDEYYLLATLRRLSSPLYALKDSIVVATRFEYLTEARLRTLLHQLGFQEIALLKYDESTATLLTFSVSHAGFFAGEPEFVSTEAPPPGAMYPSVWLIARRIPEFSAA